MPYGIVAQPLLSPADQANGFWRRGLSFFWTSTKKQGGACTVLNCSEKREARSEKRKQSPAPGPGHAPPPRLGLSTELSLR